MGFNLLAYPQLKPSLSSLPEWQAWKDEIGDALHGPVKYFGMQRWLIILGAIAYISGHVMDMYEHNESDIAVERVQDTSN